MAKKFEGSFFEFVYKSFYNNSLKLNEKTDCAQKVIESRQNSLGDIRKKMKQSGFLD